MISIGNYILHKISGVTTSVNALYTKEGIIPPYITYKRAYVNPEYCKDGLISNTTGVQVDIVSNTYVESIELAEQVRGILELNSEVYGNIRVMESSLVSVDENTDGSIYTQTLIFEFVTN